jgi:uncharacterized membrane protein YkoI
MRRIAIVALLAAALAWSGATVLRDDDRPVDPALPDARQAAAAALKVVPGRVRGVARDEDNGKWEITILQGGREYEVELEPESLGLLRLDYD